MVAALGDVLEKVLIDFGKLFMLIFWPIFIFSIRYVVYIVYIVYIVQLALHTSAKLLPW